MDSTTASGGPIPGDTSKETKLDVPFIVGMVCCAVGAVLLVFGIIRLITYFIITSQDKKMRKQTMKKIQHHRYLKDYEQKAAPSVNGYMFAHPGHMNGSVRSWTAGSNMNGAFDWSDSGTNHTYVNDGTLVKIRNGVEHNFTIQRHPEYGTGNGSLHGSSRSGLDPEIDYIDCVIVDDESMLPSSQRYADVEF